MSQSTTVLSNHSPGLELHPSELPLTPLQILHDGSLLALRFHLTGVGASLNFSQVFFFFVVVVVYLLRANLADSACVAVRGLPV